MHSHTPAPRLCWNIRKFPRDEQQLQQDLETLPGLAHGRHSMRHRSSKNVVAERNPHNSLSPMNPEHGGLATIRKRRDLFRVGATGRLASSLEQREHKYFRPPVT